MTDEATHYAIYRHEKVKDLGELQGRSSHNARTADRGLEHIDDTKPATLLLGNDDAVEEWHTKAQAAGIDKAKLRKNAVVAIEAIATTSPGWWDTATSQEKAEWQERSVAFLIEKAGGKDNILSIHLHEDETTPHIQALSIPITTKEMGARGRPKKKGAEAKPARTQTVLSATHFVGGHRDKMKDWQTEYAASVAHLGLVRGVPQKETGARNLNPAKWRAEQAILKDGAIKDRIAAEAAREAAQAAEVAALTKERKAADTLDMSQAEAQRVITNADERAEALHIGFTAIDAGELTYRPKTAEKGEGLEVRRAREASTLPPKGDSFTRFTAAVKPYLTSLTGYAKRLYALTQRESDLDQREKGLTAKETATYWSQQINETQAEKLDRREATISRKEKAIREVGKTDEYERKVALFETQDKAKAKRKSRGNQER